MIRAHVLEECEPDEDERDVDDENVQPIPSGPP